MKVMGLIAVLGFALPLAGAVERTLRIEAPANAAAGQPIPVVFFASTDAGAGEQVGFLQAEMSVDQGRTWTAICYLDKVGPKVVQRASLTPGAAGSTLRIRVRAAFRDGLAGDVDYTGAALRWHGPWKNWESPPARHASISILPR